MNLLAFVDEISANSVSEYSGLGLRHAQRYVKAIDLMMPHLLASRPERLIEAMDSDGNQNRCTIYLRRMHIRETYRKLAGGIPMNRSAYYSLGRHRTDNQKADDQWNAFSVDPVN